MYSSSVQTGCLRHQSTFHLYDGCLYTVIYVICCCLTAYQTTAEYDGAFSKTSKIVVIYLHCCDSIFNSLNQNHPTISLGKKQFADWYAKLLVNNFLVTVRWWSSRKDDISPQQITAMMKRHMISGTIPTLKEQS